MNLKIVTKILATRLAKVISSISNIDQTDTDLRRLFTHLQLQTMESQTRIVVSIDIEKAFDLVDCCYIHKVLERMGFGPIYRKWISMIYKSPRVVIRFGYQCLHFLKFFLSWQRH